MESTLVLHSELPLINTTYLHTKVCGGYEMNRSETLHFFSQNFSDTLKWNLGHTNQNANSNNTLQTFILSENSKNSYNNIVDI